MEEAPEYVTCSRCGKDADILTVFPGRVCLACYEAREGKQPLTIADYNGMIATFGGKKKAKRAR